ncbi:MAG TPA: glycerophosphodiester phosphodiesterase [Isosphaeraceae bacterium]|nr:glycerophosphodiester phosphodiesterase [Isosphaeraceae bacterium]
MIASLLTLALVWTPPANVEIIAHRGESADAPENTLSAFRLAWEREVPAIELDVHLTRDDALIVSHDGDTKRTTGESKSIKDSTLAELQSLDAGLWKGERWKGEPMPTLEQALATIPKGARCFIEVKVGDEAIPALVKAIQKSGKSPDQLTVISFHADAVAEAKRRLPDIPAYYLASFKRDKETGAWQPSLDALIDKAHDLHADGLDLSHNGPIDAEFVQKVHAAGLKLYVWTVDDADKARKLAEMGVDGITTNHGGQMKEWLSE